MLNIKGIIVGTTSQGRYFSDKKMKKVEMLRAKVTANPMIAILTRNSLMAENWRDLFATPRKTMRVRLIDILILNRPEPVPLFVSAPASEGVPGSRVFHVSYFYHRLVYVAVSQLTGH